jgi:hypothetical protein
MPSATMGRRMLKVVKDGITRVLSKNLALPGCSTLSGT